MDPKSKDLQSSGLRSRIKRFWDQLETHKKRRLTLISFTVFFLIISIWGYKAKHSGKTRQINKPEAVAEHEIKMDSGLIEKSLYTQTLDNMRKQQQQIENLSKQIDKLRNAPSPPVEKIPPPKVIEKPPPPRKKSLFTRMSPPPVSNVSIPPPPKVTDKKNFQALGGIELVQNDLKPEPEKNEKLKKKQIFLPPSFMEASLLSGVSAPTTTAAKGNPLPVLLRIKDLAILPNRVKADLKGCFLIGEAVGNLAAERVHIRLITMSCVSKKGKAVIDQKVKGFVVDEDGKVGLAGKVVAKMGMHIARSALAGFLGGVGEAVETSSLNSNFSPVTGTTNQVWSNTDSTHIARSGIGKGISNAAKELQKFYLQLAEQTMPVIEVGATKTITVVISEGTNLEIKKI